jgi:hypothetical protein
MFDWRVKYWQNIVEVLKQIARHPSSLDVPMIFKSENRETFSRHVGFHSENIIFHVLGCYNGNRNEDVFKDVGDNRNGQYGI